MQSTYMTSHDSKSQNPTNYSPLIYIVSKSAAWHVSKALVIDIALWNPYIYIQYAVEKYK